MRRSPRRLEAAIALRRRASFYSTLTSDVNPEKGASRNWSRAESQVWSEKAKANASILEDNSPQVGQSVRFLFSKILSCNDSMKSFRLVERAVVVLAFVNRPILQFSDFPLVSFRFDYVGWI